MGALLLLIAAALWGSAFVAQKMGGDHLGPFAVTFLRNVLGGAFIYLWFRARLRFFGLFVGRPAGAAAWLWVAMAVVGSYLICIEPGSAGFSVGRGEAWTLLCAALFAAQVLCVDRFAPGTDVLAFSCVQQLVGCAVMLAAVVLSQLFGQKSRSA